MAGLFFRFACKQLKLLFNPTVLEAVTAWLRPPGPESGDPQRDVSCYLAATCLEDMDSYLGESRSTARIRTLLRSDEAISPISRLLLEQHLVIFGFQYPILEFVN